MSANQQFSFPVAAVGASRSLTPSAGWQIGTAKIDNPSGMWLYLRPIGTFVPPNTLNKIISIVPKTGTLYIDYVPAPVGGVASANTGGPIDVQLFDDVLFDDVGVDYTLVPSLASLKASIDALAVLITQTNTYLGILGATTIPTYQIATGTLVNAGTPGTQVQMVPATAGKTIMVVSWKVVPEEIALNDPALTGQYTAKIWSNFLTRDFDSLSPDEPKAGANYFPYGIPMTLSQNLQVSVDSNDGSTLQFLAAAVYYLA